MSCTSFRLASEIAGIKESPRMIACCLYSFGAFKRPSRKTSHSSWFGASFVIPLTIATEIAASIPHSSICSAELEKTPYEIVPFFCNSSASTHAASRAFSVICFESVSFAKYCEMSCALGITTMPTDTGPANGPLPTSSTPTM